VHRPLTKLGSFCKNDLNNYIDTFCRDLRQLASVDSKQLSAFSVRKEQVSGMPIFFATASRTCGKSA
jgi:hypothetical protein